MTTAELQAPVNVDVQNLIVNKMQEALASEQFVGMVDTAISKCLKSCIDSIFNNYGDFAKSLEAKLKERLALHCKLDDIPEYNDLVLKIVKQKLESKLDEVLQSQIARTMDEILATAPKEITLEKLREEFEQWVGHEKGVPVEHLRDYGEYLFNIEESDTSDGYFSILMDKEADTKKFSEAFRMHCNKDGQCYALWLRGQDTQKQLFIGPLYGFAKLIFGMKAAGTRIIRD